MKTLLTLFAAPFLFLGSLFANHPAPTMPIPASTATTTFYSGSDAQPSDEYDIYHLQGTLADARQNLGATNAIETPIAVFHTSLANQITANATSMTLESALTADGTTLASSTYSFVIDSGQPTQEFVEADCTGTACTNMQRGMSVVTGTTTVVSSEQSHRRTASVDIVDAPLLIKLTNIINGVSTFPNVIGYTTDLSSAAWSTQPNTAIPSLGILRSTSIAGASNATESVNGISQLATGAQAGASTSFGSSGARLVLPSSLATSSCKVLQSSILAASSTTGKLDPLCFDQTQGYTFTGPETFNAATTTFNAPTTFAIIPTGITPIFGDGSGGASTTIATMTLTGDVYYTNLTVNNGVTLNTANYRIYVSGTLTVNGTISNNGGTGSTGATGANAGAGNSCSTAGGAGAGAVATGTVAVLTAGGTGGAGGLGNSNSPTAGCGGGGGGGGSAGGIVAIYAHNIVIGSTGLITSNGGNGGQGGNGGNGSSSNPGATDNGGAGSTGTTASVSASIGSAGSASGAGGAGGNTGSGGAGAGAGATSAATLSAFLPHVLQNVISLFDFGKSILVQDSAGGAGGGGGGTGNHVNASNGNCAGGAGGGGSGGSGGVTILAYSTISNLGSITETGGTGGSAGTAGTVVGAACTTNPTSASAGATGTTGKLYQVTI